MLYALLAFIVIDYITGVMCAVVTRDLSSEIGFHGICRKVLIFLLVGIANIVDMQLIGNGSVLRTAVIFFYISNEGLSIVENAAILGLPIPNELRNVLKQIREGRQAYVVCPLVEMNEELPLPSAEEVYEELRYGIFRGIPCGLIHGRMKAADKEAVMQAFHAGKIKLLVSTTVIEVGVNVPNASIMVVEHAERFGLAQLHQLRGRIGRGPYQSFCILVSDSRTETAKERLRIMESTNDGFLLAEEDLKLRGPGEFFGAMQHGLPDLKIADVLTDLDILLKARQAALETMEREQDMRQVLSLLSLQYREHFSHIMET